MRVFLTGVSDIGKTTIGRILADMMEVNFFDLDAEIEIFFGTSIERLQRKMITISRYREEAAKALSHLLESPASERCVIALPPSGLMGGFLKVVSKAAGITVALFDTPQNLMQRVTFYDLDSKPIDRKLTLAEQKWYLSEIKKDIVYFGRTYHQAHLHVEISGLTIEQSAAKVLQTLRAFNQEAGHA